MNKHEPRKYNMNRDKKERNSGQNKVAIVGFGLILLVISITLIKPVLRGKPEKESTASEPVAVYSDYEYITSKELQEKINTNNESIVIVDIRDSVSFEKEHIEKSINVTPEKIEEKIKDFSKKSMIIVVGYDFEDKNAEAGAVKFFKDYGFNEVVALSGGIFAWKQNLNPTISAGDPDSALDISKIEEILPEQLKIAIENNYPTFIIDVRSEKLFLQGHVPGAVNIPLGELEGRKEEIPSSKEIIAYGDSDLSDFQAGVKLHDLGFLASYILKGGYKSWQEKRFPVEN